MTKLNRMANKNLRGALSLPRNVVSKNIAEATTVQADTATNDTATHETVTPETYIRNISNYDRFEAIRRDMWEKHRWSIGTFLHQMVTAEPRKLYDWSIKTRVKKLSEAIAQKEVIEPLMKYLWDELSENVISTLAKRIRVEIDRLGSTDIGLGSFNPETTVHELDIPHIHDRIQKAAPALCNLFFALLEPKYPSKRDLVKANQGLVTIIAASIAHAYAPNTYDTFQMLLGVHLHSMGVKRRSLSLLAGLGLIPSYRNIMRKRATLADIGKVIPLSWIYIIVSFMIAN